jgi:flagellar hook-associated protein 3 FlgL
MQNKQRMNQLTNELTTGIKVNKPGDSTEAGSISRYRQLIDKADSYLDTIAQTKSFLDIQDNLVAQATELMIRAKELAQQAANETLSPTSRSQIAEEVFQVRDQMANIANTTFQGRYIYSGVDDDNPPYDQTTYTNPASGNASVRYVFDNEPGKDVSKSVRVTDEISVSLNTPANELFGTSLEALERLARSLAGYKTEPASGTPDGSGDAYTMPADFHQQTEDIKATIELINRARDNDLIPERISIGGRIRRLETGQALLELTKSSAKEVLSRIQDADETETAANLQQAQTALQASYSITAKVLRMTILDYV